MRERAQESSTHPKLWDFYVKIECKCMHVSLALFHASCLFFCRRSIVRSFIRSWLPWLLMRRDYTYFGNAIPFYVLVLALVFRLLVPRPHCIASVAPSSTLSSSRCRHYRMLHAYEIVALNVHQECLAKLRTHTHTYTTKLSHHTRFWFRKTIQNDSTPI